MGPEFSSLSSFLAAVGDALSVELENLIEMGEGIFWIALNIVFGSLFIWVTCSFIVMTKLDLKLHNIA
jgi:hypothetical protein